MTALASDPPQRYEGYGVEHCGAGQLPLTHAADAVAATNVVTFPIASGADPHREKAGDSLVMRWRSCCAALFAIGATPPDDVSEQILFDATVLPLLWPPY